MMSNFICPTCGMNNIDCGTDGYKTDREIELEEKLDIAVKSLNEIKSMTFERYLMNNGWVAVRQLRDEARKALAKITEIK